MDVLAVLLAIGVMTASFYAGGPFGVLVAMAVLDVPSGSRHVASDFVSGGGWLLLALGGLAALGVGLYYLREHREAESAAVPRNPGVGP